MLPPPKTPGNSRSVSNAVGCGSLTKDDLAKYIVYTQLLEQVRDVESAKAVKTKAFTDYTPAAFATVLDHLSVLVGRPVQGFDDPAASLAYYTKANEILSRIVAATGESPQSLINEHKTSIVDTSTAIKNQTLHQRRCLRRLPKPELPPTAGSLFVIGRIET